MSDTEVIEPEVKTDDIKEAKRKKLIKYLKIAIIIVCVYLVVIAVAACIVDGRHAEIEMNGSDEVRIEYGSAYNDAGAVAYSRGRVFGEWSKQPEVTVSGKVDSARLGEYEIIYTAEVFGREATSTRRVIVEDTTPPVITLDRKNNNSATWFDGYIEEGFSASDNVDGDLTASVVRTEDGNTVKYTVTDSSGNTATAERAVTYTITSPILALNGEADMWVQANQGFTDPGCSATDSLGNDLSQYLTVDGSVTPWIAGTYGLTYSITNARGDSASVQRTVNVYSVDRPAVVKPEEKTIFLTFDDGPGPYTEELLDILDAYGVKATFFVTNCDSRYANMIGEAYRRGHAIGVHTYNHNYYDIYASEQAYFDDFNAMENLIYQQTGNYTNIFRFPGGSSNTVSSFNPGIMSRLSQAMQDMGYRYFDWNISSGDAGETKDTDQIVENVTDGCKEHTLCVVLQHDIKDYSVAAVEEIIIWGLENGYKFSSLNMTSFEAHHGIAN